MLAAMVRVNDSNWAGRCQSGVQQRRGHHRMVMNVAMGMVWRTVSATKLKVRGGVVKVIAIPTRETAGGVGRVVVDT